MAIRQWNNLQDHRKRLDDLRNMLRQDTAREVRKELRRDICKEVAAKVKMLKGEQLDRLVSGYFDRGKQSFEMQLEDGPSTNRDMLGLLLRMNMAVKSTVIMRMMKLLKKNG